MCCVCVTYRCGFQCPQVVQLPQLLYSSESGWVEGEERGGGGTGRVVEGDKGEEEGRHSVFVILGICGAQSPPQTNCRNEASHDIM